MLRPGLLECKAEIQVVGVFMSEECVICVISEVILPCQTEMPYLNSDPRCQNPVTATAGHFDIIRHFQGPASSCASSDKRINQFRGENIVVCNGHESDLEIYH